MNSLGINIGSTSVKVTLIEAGKVVWNIVEPHEGNFIDTLKKSWAAESFPTEYTLWQRELKAAILST